MRLKPTCCADTLDVVGLVSSVVDKLFWRSRKVDLPVWPLPCCYVRERRTTTSMEVALRIHSRDILPSISSVRRGHQKSIGLRLTAIETGFHRALGKASPMFCRCTNMQFCLSNLPGHPSHHYSSQPTGSTKYPSSSDGVTSCTTLPFPSSTSTAFFRPSFCALFFPRPFHKSFLPRMCSIDPLVDASVAVNEAGLGSSRRLDLR